MPTGKAAANIRKKTASGANAFFFKKNYRKKQFMHTKTVSAALLWEIIQARNGTFEGIGQTDTA